MSTVRLTNIQGKESSMWSSRRPEPQRGGYSHSMEVRSGRRDCRRGRSSSMQIWPPTRRWLAEWYSQKAVLVTNCSFVATIIASKNGGRSSLKLLIDKTIETGHRLSAWTVLHKRGESNSVALELAQLAKPTHHSVVWQIAAPLCVEQIITQECSQVFE